MTKREQDAANELAFALLEIFNGNGGDVVFSDLVEAMIQLQVEEEILNFFWRQIR